jgi:hypothetical protein
VSPPMQSTARLVCVLLAGTALVTFGCENVVDTPSVVVSDSAGVRVVVSTAPFWRDSVPWSIASTPTTDLTTSGTGSAHEFFVVSDALRLRDGRLVVSDVGSGQVRFYSAEGEFISATGRRGDGPGEFRNVRTLSKMRGDSIVAYDVFLNRLTVMDTNGAVGRVVSLGAVFGRARHLRAFGDSMFLGLVDSFSGTTQEGRYRVPYAVIQLSETGSAIDTVTWLDGREGFSTGAADGPLPFRKDGHLAIHQKEFVLGSADSLMYDRYLEAGRHMQRAAVRGYDLQLAPEQIDSARQALHPQPDRPPPPPGVLDFIETVEIPGSRPAYSKLLLDAAGYVWAAQSHGRTQSETVVGWEVFSPEGEWLGTMSTPAGFDILEIGKDYVLGVRRDERDVEHVEVRQLHRGPEDPGF